MLNSMKLYKVLTYILIPIAYFFAFIDVMFLMSALANPAALIVVFGIACLVIYTLLSFKFYKQGVLSEQPLNAKTKDWIKVNAIVSIILCSLFCLDGVSVLGSSNATLLKYIDDYIIQKPGMPADANANMLLTVLKAVSVILLITGTVGLLHIRTTLRLLKQYSYLFE
jgi:hypothetical protein